MSQISPYTLLLIVYVTLAATLAVLAWGRRSAKALRESEERYRSLFDRVPIGLYRTTAAGEILEVNPALVQMLGYPDRESLLARNAAEFFVNPEDRQREQAMLERNGFLRDFESQQRCYDGSVIWVRDTARAARNAQGGMLYYEGSLEDITARKRAEEERQNLEAQLRQAQKMEALGLLAGGIAHEFNNLLTVIRGNAELALSALEPAAVGHDELSAIRRTSERAATLTRDILAFSRRQVLRRVELDLNAQLGTLSGMLRRLIGEPIELRCELAPDLSPVLADAGAIEQAAVNLVLNARDAMPEGGVLSISTAHARLDEASCHGHAQAKPGDYVRLTVTDSGVGMDESVKAHLFEPFFTTKEVGKGSGLGLPVVYGIVEQHGGWIEVESQVGQGSRFDIYLPVAATAADVKREA